jgi:hypothetical protein
MRAMKWAIVVWLAALSCASAQEIDLVCGLDLISIDLAARFVTFQHGSLDESTRQLTTETYRDGYTYAEEARTVVQFVLIEPDAVTFGATRWISTTNSVLDALWRLDRRTGILIAKPPNPSNICTLAPPRRLF